MHGFVLGFAQEGLFVASIQCTQTRVFGEASKGLVALTWRDSGPLPRRRGRAVPGFATISSLGLGRDVRLTRAFLVPTGRWTVRGPLLGVEGHDLAPSILAATLPAADAERDTAAARVSDVRASYGELLIDIAYRIENSAMFDSSVAPTRRFEDALAAWDDVTEATPVDVIVRRGAMVKITFDAARANAETLGFGHLPATARDDARRAAGAARLAAGSDSVQERAAAWRQVNTILSSLSLYYLPTIDRGQLHR